MNQEEMIQETHDTVIKLKTVLLGSNGDDGLIGDVKRLAKSQSNLKRNFYILLGTLIGSGIIGVGVSQIIG